MPNQFYLSKCPSLKRRDTKSYTLNDIYDECREVCNYLDMAYPMSSKKMEKVTFCVKWGKDKTGTLGSCHRNLNDFNYTLTFNPTFFKLAEPEQAHSVIVHEVLHMGPDCMKHTGNWKMMARNCESHLGVTVTRTTRDKNYAEMRQSKYKYYISCNNCGYKCAYKMKMTPCLKTIKSGHHNYWCTKCKSHDLKFNEI